MIGRNILLCILISFLEVYGQCPHTWVSHHAYCYHFNTTARVSWVDATIVCSTHSSQLVSILSAEEDRFIVDHLRPLIDESEGSDKLTSVWIGGTDDQVEGSWMWYGLEQPIIEYTNWYPGEPDTGDGDHEEDCICLVGNHGYLWQDHNCKEQMFFVCQKRSHGSGIVG